MKNLTCFKAYDIRGELGEELNVDIAYKIGRATGEFLSAKTMVVGGDVRLTSKELKAAIAEGLMDAGVDVLDIGLCGTEEIYFATSHLNLDGGIMITASHNPINFNGMKLVRENSRPLSNDTGLLDIKYLAEQANFKQIPKEQRGSIKILTVADDYIKHLLTYIDADNIQPIKLVVNAGNGTAGPTIDKLEQAFLEYNIPIELIKIHNIPDGTFPNGIPNPLLHEQQAITGEQVAAHGADMGIAWDGDFDRCFLWDANGQFIDGYYIVGLLAGAFLAQQPGSTIIHDPRLTWNTIDIVSKGDGNAVMSKTGHAFIKEIMRERDAVYGGEMSAHHYFRDFFYCDSGMIPWLLVVDLLSKKKVTLQSLVQSRMDRFPSPGEINSKVSDADTAIERVFNEYKDKAIKEDRTDGLSLEFEDWRFNLRLSNTEPVVRLNIETRGDKKILTQHCENLLKIIRA
ncbi:MAG: phosphomannomutase CpsG [Gammaproteobacteria bacterium]|nr:MAG: phosphomannomutase CpsG [Gammaproteobacteria bacterium]